MVLGVLFVASVLFNLKLLRNQKEPEKTYRVESVVDGDTFRLPGGKRVRLHGIDAPEMPRCMAIEAKKALEQEILGKDVYIRDKFTDYFGRDIGNVFVGDRYVNEIIVAKGFARPDYEPSPYKQRIVAAYGQARKKGLGLNSGKCVTFDPPDPNCPVKANVSRDDRTRYYYLPSCLAYSSVRVDTSSEDRWFCKESEAKELGFVPAPKCF